MQTIKFQTKPSQGNEYHVTTEASNTAGSPGHWDF